LSDSSKVELLERACVARERGEDLAVVELAEKLLRVRDRSGTRVPLRANVAQRLFEEQRARQNIVLKARQMGLTTWIAARFFLRTITAHGVMTVQVAQTREAAESIFRMVQRMWENLPDSLRDGKLRRSRANVGQMIFPELDSEFRVTSAAVNAGRGLTIHNLHCSEVARWTGDAKETLAGLRAALAPDGELVMESTPNGAYGAFYEQWCAAVDAASGALGAVWCEEQTQIPCGNDKPEGACGYQSLNGGPGAVWCEEQTQIPCGNDKPKDSPTDNAKDSPTDKAGDSLTDNARAAGAVVRHFMPWWMEPAYAGPAIEERAWSEEERALVARHGLTARQIGFRRDLALQYGVLRSQEFAEDAETCFRATGDCCFEVEALEKRLQAVEAPLAVRRNGALQLYLAPQPGREYLVAVDAAGGGVEGDFAAIEVIERASGLQCAELQQRLNPLATAMAAAELAREFNEAEICVERNNHGAAVIAYLEAACGVTKLWRAADGAYGFLTTAVSKPEMIARLGALLVERPALFASQRLLRECRTFLTLEAGRQGAANGEHDDLVMAMAMAQRVR
jgi:hypothetical protein